MMLISKMTVRTFLTKRLERGRDREKRNKYSEIERERRFTEMFSLVSVFKVCNLTPTSALARLQLTTLNTTRSTWHVSVQQTPLRCSSVK